MAGISVGLCLHLLTLLLSVLASFSLADSRTGCWNMVYSILRGLRHQRECLSLTVWQNPQQDPDWPSLGLELLVLRTITMCVHWRGSEDEDGRVQREDWADLGLTFTPHQDYMDQESLQKREGWSCRRKNNGYIKTFSVLLSFYSSFCPMITP